MFQENEKIEFSWGLSSEYSRQPRINIFIRKTGILSALSVTKVISVSLLSSFEDPGCPCM